VPTFREQSDAGLPDRRAAAAELRTDRIEDCGFLADDAAAQAEELPEPAGRLGDALAGLDDLPDALFPLGIGQNRPRPPAKLAWNARR
jgi:hypothetical protein